MSFEENYRNRLKKADLQVVATDAARDTLKELVQNSEKLTCTDFKFGIVCGMSHSHTYEVPARHSRVVMQGTTVTGRSVKITIEEE